MADIGKEYSSFQLASNNEYYMFLYNHEVYKHAEPQIYGRRNEKKHEALAI